MVVTKGSDVTVVTTVFEVVFSCISTLRETLFPLFKMLLKCFFWSAVKNSCNMSMNDGSI